jgi:hypothetical protein
MISLAVQEDTLISDVLRAVETYCEYNKIYKNKIITNPFVVSETGIPVIPYQEIEKVKNTTAKIILIDMFAEGYDIAERFINDLPKDKKYIIFANGWWDKSQVNSDINYEILYWPFFINEIVTKGTNYWLIDFFQDKNYNFDKPKEFFFSTTIGRQKNWRDILSNRIINEVNFKNYILNYNGVELAMPSREMDVNYNFEQFNTHTIRNSIPIDMYNNSELLLVVETNMLDHNEFHLTEKTAKALITGIPFIIAGSYKFLENLRELGFQTYSELWSEEYDNIINVDDRTTAIIELLNKLKKTSWDQTKAKQIAAHNKACILNCNKIISKQIEKIIDRYSTYGIKND